MVMPITITMSSIGVSNIANTDYMGGKTVSAAVVFTSTGMTADYLLQYAIQDVTQTVSTAALTWYDTSSVHLSASSSVVVFLNPIAGLRISSTAISSSSLRLNVLQG